MGKKVPVPVENIAFERLDLSRHYLTVDCDATCFLVLNPSGEIPIEGTDICALHTGAWQIDAWKLLTKKDFPNQAGFVACLVWDKTLISDSVHVPACVESDIDTANSVSSLKGQPVNITGFSMPEGQALPVVLPSDSAKPVFTRASPFYFSEITKNASLSDDKFELLKVASLRFETFTTFTTFTLRPRYCQEVLNSNNILLTYDIYPEYMVEWNHGTGKTRIMAYEDNLLFLQVDNESPHIVKRINFTLTGTSVNASSDNFGTRSNCGSSDLAQLSRVEF